MGANDHEEEIPAALFEFFEAMPRQGPGSPQITAALYDRIAPQLPTKPKAADMGCGTGAAGLVLLEKGAKVIGVDVHLPFLESFQATAQEKGLAENLETFATGMTETGLPDASLDLIWSEGAVYIVGFDVALAEFKRLLKPGGIAVISECTWLQEAPPKEPTDFWAKNYPEMRTQADNIAAIEAAGWQCLHTETLPAQTWEENFYGPMEELSKTINHATAPDLAAIAEEQTAEAGLFRRYNEFYGYVFYVIRKVL